MILWGFGPSGIMNDTVDGVMGGDRVGGTPHAEADDVEFSPIGTDKEKFFIKKRGGGICEEANFGLSFICSVPQISSLSILCPIFRPFLLFYDSSLIPTPYTPGN